MKAGANTAARAGRGGPRTSCGAEPGRSCRLVRAASPNSSEPPTEARPAAGRSTAIPTAGAPSQRGEPEAGAEEYVDTRLYLAHVAQAVFDGGFVSDRRSDEGRAGPHGLGRSRRSTSLAHQASAPAGARGKRSNGYVTNSRRVRRSTTSSTGVVQVLGQDRLTLRGVADRRSWRVRLPPASAQTDRGA